MNSISIIVPIYKGKRYIDGLIQMFDKAAEQLHHTYPMVMVQTSFINDYPDNELIESCFYLPEHMSCSYMNPGIHQGIHATRIYGLKHTTSDFVIFFDQDDRIESNYLLSQYEKMLLDDCSYDGVVCNGIYRGNRLIYSDIRPVEMTFNRKALLEKRWNPLSPGQVLIRRKSIPVELWCKYILKHNLADDWLLWFLMVHVGCCFKINSDVLYTHVEDGTNSSQNWKEMGQARVELLETLRKLDVLTAEEDAVLRDRIEMYLIKYDRYIKLDELLEQADHAQLINGIHAMAVGRKIAIYGIGIYGKKMSSIARMQMF